jgi:hypothetical protein
MEDETLVIPGVGIGDSPDGSMGSGGRLMEMGPREPRSFPGESLIVLVP